MSSGQIGYGGVSATGTPPASGNLMISSSHCSEQPGLPHCKAVQNPSVRRYLLTPLPRFGFGRRSSVPQSSILSILPQVLRSDLEDLVVVEKHSRSLGRTCVFPLLAVKGNIDTAMQREKLQARAIIRLPPWISTATWHSLAGHAQVSMMSDVPSSLADTEGTKDLVLATSQRVRVSINLAATQVDSPEGHSALFTDQNNSQELNFSSLKLLSTSTGSRGRNPSAFAS
ncbi:hypothetical protein B0T16DRAFT_1149 [Cercophora newfieldiana]|uniref:Uncharacterized protein n=1 Tax=Cercophora newfieldiana TaxID=92897 RepID=A0AA39YMZ0_9PEZI|nr:hypothetical protein B0T16DRAFT_1149 [Cercophora newfieldiana]